MVVSVRCCCVCVTGAIKVQGKSVACGGLHTVVLGAKGQLLAWGANHEGQVCAALRACDALDCVMRLSAVGVGAGYTGQVGKRCL